MLRVRLENARTVAQAQAELRRLLTQREDGALPVAKLTPKFSELARHYLEIAQATKRSSTLETETAHLHAWIAHLGGTRLSHIKRPAIDGFITKRKTQGVSNRTINLGIVVLRNLLNKAIDEGWIKTLPTENLRPLKWTPRKRELFSAGQIEKTCASALKASKNGQEFSDYLRLMAYCGARMAETLRLKWADVDWQNRQLTIGADGQSKNGQARVVDFNPKLAAHLQDMLQRRAPDSQWVFPSPQRGNQDRSSKTFRETLIAARREAGLPKFGFHDCRHYFISACVMSGIDYMTIAKWVGHQDGGILIGKVYGHLSNEHAEKQAQKIQLGQTDGTPGSNAAT